MCIIVTSRWNKKFIYGVISMEKRLLITNLIISAIILVLLIAAFFTKSNYIGDAYDLRIDAGKGWYYLDSDGSLTDKKG